MGWLSCHLKVIRWCEVCDAFVSSVFLVGNIKVNLFLLVTHVVENKWHHQLPSKFGIIIDLWKEGATHYIALYLSLPRTKYPYVIPFVFHNGPISPIMALFPYEFLVRKQQHYRNAMSLSNSSNTSIMNALCDYAIELCNLGMKGLLYTHTISLNM